MDPAESGLSPAGLETNTTTNRALPNGQSQSMLSTHTRFFQEHFPVFYKSLLLLRLILIEMSHLVAEN